MKVPLIFLVALGLASQVSSQKAPPNAIDYNEEIAYVCWQDDIFNALKPTHIADVARDFCSGKAQETLLAIGHATHKFPYFERPDGKEQIAVQARIFRHQTEEEEKTGHMYSLPPVRVPLDTCIKLMNVVIEECSRKYSGGDLTRFGGGAAHIKPYSWTAMLRPAPGYKPGMKLTDD
ncbi:hypothetical protein FQN53_000052 [Emmonsiellopsis sp. PD_33]|nr:hypothetical protein FQN53_000052 [Emmonsiellopsis sp. PD_33]